MNSNTHKTKVIPIVIGVVLIGLASTAWWLSNTITLPEVNLPGVQVESTPFKLDTFTLVDHHGTLFDQNRLKNHWTIMFSGYTHCPDICPTTLGVMNMLYKKLNKRPEGIGNTQFVFVSVDPHRDTPKVMADYVNFINPKFIGVTAENNAQIDQLGSSLGIIYDFEEAKTGEPISDVTTRPVTDKYVVNHYAAIFLIDPNGRLVASILPPHDGSRVLETYKTIKNAYDR